jgi:hypothetical protein
MLSGYVFRILLVGIFAVLVIPGHVHATKRLANDAPVIVAEDVTSKGTCILWYGSPETTVPCPPGTMFSIYKTTFAEAQRAGVTKFTTLTGNANDDELAANRLVAELHSQPSFSRGIEPLSTCTPRTNTMGGTYFIGGGPNISWEMNYQVTSTCATINMVDRQKASQDNVVRWKESGVDRTGVLRGVTLKTSWSIRYNLPNGAVGQNYGWVDAWNSRDYVHSVPIPANTGD